MAPYPDQSTVEPLLAEILEEPIVKLLMERDHVTRHQLSALIQRVQGAISRVNEAGAATATHDSRPKAFTPAA